MAFTEKVQWRILVKDKITGEVSLFAQSNFPQGQRWHREHLRMQIHSFSGYACERWDDRLNRWHRYLEWGLMAATETI